MAWHVFAESSRLAYADRDMYIGDPDFVKVPVKGLLDAAYLKKRSALISAATTIADPMPGMPAGAPPRIKAPYKDDPGTSDLAVVDGDGNVVQVTTTVNGYFGNGVPVDGIMLNNELPDFDFIPEKDGYLTVNRVEGGKRPRSSMSPTIVYDASGQPVLAIGAAGGSTIIAQVAKALVGVLDWEMDVGDAIALPQIYAPGDRVAIEAGSRLEDMTPALIAKGHTPTAAKLPLKANGIERKARGWIGGADPRSEGAVTGL